MDKIISKEVHNSLDANCFNRTNKRKRKCETANPEQRNRKLPCKVSPVYDFVRQSRKDSLKLLILKREQKRKEDIEGSNFF